MLRALCNNLVSQDAFFYPRHSTGGIKMVVLMVNGNVVFVLWRRGE